MGLGLGLGSGLGLGLGLGLRAADETSEQRDPPREQRSARVEIAGADEGRAGVEARECLVRGRGRGRLLGVEVRECLTKRSIRVGSGSGSGSGSGWS